MAKNKLSREQAEQIYSALKNRVEKILNNSEKRQEADLENISGSSKVRSQGALRSFSLLAFGFVLILASFSASWVIFMPKLNQYLEKVSGFTTSEASIVTRASLTLPKTGQDQNLTEGSKIEELALALEAKRIELEQRESELTAKMGELKFLEQLIEDRLEALKAYVNRAKALESDQNQAERSKIETLANLFLSMPVQQAGSLLAGLENDVIAEILIKMPERRSAALLAQLPRDRGVKIAKLMAEFKNPAE